MHHDSRIPLPLDTRHLRRRNAVLLAAVTAVLTTAFVVTTLVVARTPAEGIGYSPAVDAPSSYDQQTTCTKVPQPGTVALARWLQRTYPVTGSMGLMRACGAGGTSEHKDGRAFDWAADVARPKQRAAAYAFIRRALATDARGNEHALARRMGIMYLIYDDTIWSSYRDFAPQPYLNRGCSSVKTCSRSLRHLNHVHISLGFAGAAAQTSWYRARDVASKPVLHPGTRYLDPEDTAVTGFTVPGDGRAGASSFKLKAGVTYRVVVTGTVRYADGRVGDANCTWPAGTAQYQPTDRGLTVDPDGDGPTDPDDGGWGWGGWGEDVEGSTHSQSPASLVVPTTNGLLLRGQLRWELDTCRADHTYETWYRPLVDERLQLRYFDLTPKANTGTFTAYVARDDIVRSSLARQVR